MFSLTWPASKQIYWNKRKRLHKKRDQLPQDCLGHKHSHRFIVLRHQYGRHDFMWKHTIQGTQNLVTEKCSHNLCICYLYSMDTSIQGKGHFFWVPLLYLTSIHWSPYSNQKVTHHRNRHKYKCSLVMMAIVFKRWINSLKLMYCTCWNSTHTIAVRDKLIMIFIHYLAVWNNNDRRFRSLWEQTPFSSLIMIFYLLVNY